MPGPESDEATYSLGAVTRMTGVTAATLRAWERRYEAVVPSRTEGGTRRYRESDIRRLRLLKAAVEAGHRIGDVAGLPDAELAARAPAHDALPASPIDAIFEALEKLDAAESERLLSFQLAALGPTRFAGNVALPLLDAVGRGWQERRLGIASEHLASSLLRSFLGAALRPAGGAADRPRIVFATVPGERHELGLLSAAVMALGAGAEPIYLGAELPIDELVRSVELSGASALALSFLLRQTEASKVLKKLRRALPRDIEIWVGGTAAMDIEFPEGVVALETLDSVEERVGFLNA